MTVSTEAVSSLDLSSHRILRGPLALEVARFGTPLAIGMGLQTTFNLVDLYIVGGLPKDEASTAFAALGFCDMVVAAMTILSYGLSIATGAILSRRIGEGDYAGVRRVACS
jgi:Na+-driven multidrug efflux pump